jgi:hypothetical protein
MGHSPFAFPAMEKSPAGADMRHDFNTAFPRSSQLTTDLTQGKPASMLAIEPIAA